MFILAVEDFWLNNWPVPTKFYYHNAASSVAGILPSATISSTSSSIVYGSGASTIRSLSAVVGSSQNSQNAGWSTTVGGLVTYGMIAKFASSELAAQTIPAGNWFVSLAAKDTPGANDGGSYMEFTLAAWRPSTGTLVGTLANLSGDTYGGFLSESVSSGTFAGSSLDVQNGDILVVEVAVFGSQDLPTSAANGTQTFYYDGTTEGSATSNAAFLQAPGQLTFGSSVVGSSIRLLALTGVGS